MRGFFYSPFFWLGSGLLFAFFFGWRLVHIFIQPGNDGKYHKKWEWWIYQIWFNASGAFIGWGILYFLSKVKTDNFNIGHLAALIVAFLGITGNLPYAALIGRTPGLKQ